MVYEYTGINIVATLVCLILLKIEKHASNRKLKLCDYSPDWINSNFLSHVDERESWSRMFRKSPAEAKWTPLRELIIDSLERSYIKSPCGTVKEIPNKPRKQ